ncbi:1-acyl-sn-glycerol-3-phosphate acyltransferase [Candidatus Pelagadaptatus aseana]|uniref:1-acyl-sn-glycerol-3-phosphate acyltransferase n=1 Tax=Candidatus Pelagadaptatus aseana TaxID=3120508 RepID=UPI003C6FB4C0
MSNFDDIRPYNDSEVRPALDRLVKDPELINALCRLRFPKAASGMGWLLKPLVSKALQRQLHGIDSVAGLQQLVSGYLDRMMQKRVDHFSISGLDKLDPDKPYLFISNHRDIAMDPAFINWALHSNGYDTVRIAIGDNLLTKPYVSDLMRLNKSFIVNRSAETNREKFKASKHLSAYMHHSIVEEKSNLWIAQREGRAKDGRDATNAAVISMLALSKPKAMSLTDYIGESNIVPVAISYEWDPCDAAKTNELHTLQQTGNYEKSEHEDVASIAAGIAGDKGSVHVAFGDVLAGEYESTDQVAAEIDRQIWDNYVLHPSNLLAYEMLTGKASDLPVGASQEAFDSENFHAQKLALMARLCKVDDLQRDILLGIYANPVIAKLS